MRIALIITGLFLGLLTTRSQAQNGPILQIDDSQINHWITKNKNDYQASYHFSQSELESSLILIIDKDSCYAYIKSGHWDKNNGKDVWIQEIENLKNVRIEGNKFFSNRTNGEFVIFYNEDIKPTKGLLIYKPWSTWIFYANKKGQEIGFFEDLCIPSKF